jgi:anti-sigma regulatory factor (Ser/Thr protein kinase)
MSLSSIRRMVHLQAATAGVPSERTADFVVAANEIATNAVVHGSGSAVLHMWVGTADVVCEVVDGGRIDDPLAGRRLPPRDTLDHRGLWMVNQLCDLVELRSGPSGTTVRVHIARLPRALGVGAS